MSKRKSQLSARELRLLLASNREHRVRVVCSSAGYSCCGRPMHRREGYEQTYYGYAVCTPTLPQFLLYAEGLGTLTYVCEIRYDAVEEVTSA